MDRFTAMSLLIAAVDAGSLSAVSRQRHMPLATVSRKISELEDHLGARLLVRSTRGLALTDAGREYVAACRNILESVEQAERVAAGEFVVPRGELVVTAPAVFGRLYVAPLVSGFLQAHPDISVRLLLADRILNLVDDHVDAAVRVGALPDSDLIATRVGAVNLVVCATPAYLAARGEPVKPADLAGHDCITFEAQDRIDTWHFPTAARDLKVPVRTRLAVNTADAAIAAALDGLGITRVLSYQVDAAIAEGRLKRLLQDYEPPARPVHVVHASQRRLPLKLRAFFDYVVPRLRTELSESSITP